MAAAGQSSVARQTWTSSCGQAKSSGGGFHPDLARIIPYLTISSHPLKVNTGASGIDQSVTAGTYEAPATV
jgi:hypothetical protein